jgi:ribosomal protein S18 acetylase RimI-like enzyme
MTVEPGHRRAADTDRQVPPGTHIRLATDSDAERVAVTHVAAWRRGYAGQMPEALLAGLSVQERTGLWRMALAPGSDTGAQTLVAVSSGDIVGFATGGRARDDDIGPNAGELWALNVHPDAWGCGIGSALHDATMIRLAAAGFTWATLWVLTSNTRARRFYERRGWAVDGRSKTEWEGEVPLRETRYEFTWP